MNRRIEYPFSFIQLWAACLVAQLLYATVSILALMGLGFAAGVSFTGAGLGEAILKTGLLLLVAGFVLLPLSFLVVPTFIRFHSRAFLGATASYGWTFLSNLVSTLLAGATLFLLFLIPGAQPVVGLAMLLAASGLCALMLRPRTAVIQKSLGQAVRDIAIAEHLEAQKASNASGETAVKASSMLAADVVKTPSVSDSTSMQA